MDTQSSAQKERAVIFNISLPVGLVRALDAEAKAQERSRTGLVRWILAEKFPDYDRVIVGATKAARNAMYEKYLRLAYAISCDPNTNPVDSCRIRDIVDALGVFGKRDRMRHSVAVGHALKQCGWVFSRPRIDGAQVNIHRRTWPKCETCVMWAGAGVHEEGCDAGYIAGMAAAGKMCAAAALRHAVQPPPVE